MSNKIEELVKLGELLKSGVVNQTEFESLKKELLFNHGVKDCTSAEFVYSDENSDLENPWGGLENDEPEEIYFSLENEELKEGSKYGGGIVFHLDNSKKYGLVVAENFIGESIWGIEGICLGISNDGSGSKNTETIIKNASTEVIEKTFFNICYKREIKPIMTAARMCSELILNGFNDWFLPSIDDVELLGMTLSPQLLDKSNYWTSSEKNANEAWVQLADVGVCFEESKSLVAKVLPIRKIKIK